MTASNVEASADHLVATTDFETEVLNTFGVLPNFFKTANEAPGLIAELWQFAKSGYLDNPLPSLFKERLFVHLSRFCQVRYCIVRHVGFLMGEGNPAGDASACPQTVDQVVELLRRPGIPASEVLDVCLSRLEAYNEPRFVPEPGTEAETDVFNAVSVLFLEPGNAGRARKALRSALGPGVLELLTAYLAFIRTAHYWTETHPELAFESDMEELMRRHEELAFLLLDKSDAVKGGMGQRLFDELALLREERDERVALQTALAEREIALRHQELLVNELNHRVKNTLAIIQSIAFQTLKGDETTPAVRDAFMARLMALAVAHDILTEESWEGAGLRDVVTLATGMHAAGDGVQRIGASGPDVRLAPKAAVALSMAFHELATNAAKYGCLSNDTGHVEVTWTVEEDGTDRRLSLAWSEIGGPPVVEPKKKGFGSRLIERGLAGELDGEASIAYRETGLVCRLTALLPR